jgi:hypothetical protein
MLDAANDVVNESAGTTGHSDRFNFAVGILHDPERWFTQMLFACAAEGSLTTSSTDGEIKTVISALWDGFSGVSQ